MTDSFEKTAVDKWDYEGRVVEHMAALEAELRAAHDRIDELNAAVMECPVCGHELPTPVDNDHGE